ncbi:p110_2L [African swine fever virus]|uniref:p110_2L n=1 Tax=African swine fever virus TaxID=10497 RepID=A0A8A1UGC2_ASF|nr:p110_2L [African swine fever virus]
MSIYYMHGITRLHRALYLENGPISIIFTLSVQHTVFHGIPMLLHRRHIFYNFILTKTILSSPAKPTIFHILSPASMLLFQGIVGRKTLYTTYAGYQQAEVSTEP